MIDGKKVLAVVPARGGSKGLPGKNLRDLLGHPLMAYSVKAGLDAQYVDRVLVSTDDDEIAATGEKYGAEVPFLRPSDLAADQSTDLEFWLHALDYLREEEGYEPEYVVQLRPTSPIRPTGLIDECVRKLHEAQADSLRVVTPAPATPYKMWEVDEKSDRMSPLLQLPSVIEPQNQARQTLPQVYWQIGTLDVIRTEVITERHRLSGDAIVPFILDTSYAVDIDTLADFNRAANILSLNGIVRFQ